MMEGIGVDIEAVSRFSKIKYEKRKKFYNKIFTSNEIKYCLSKVDPYPHFTARFCAKEAAIKALQDHKINFKDIEVKMKNNKPILKLAQNKQGLISISHTKKYAIAFVLIY